MQDEPPIPGWITPSPYRLWSVGSSSPDGFALFWVPVGDGWWTITWKMTSSWTRSTRTWVTSTQQSRTPPLAWLRWNPWSVSPLSWMCFFLRWARAFISACLCFFFMAYVMFSWYAVHSLCGTVVVTLLSSCVGHHLCHSWGGQCPS